MSRPRKHDKGLPEYVRIKSGAYYYRDKKLSRVVDGESAMYDALAKKKALPDLDTIPIAVAQFKSERMSALSPSARKEHERLLKIFAHEFREFTVEQVTSVDIKRSARQLFAGKDFAAKAYKSRISTFFIWCISDAGLCTVNPCTSVRLKKPRSRKTPWTDELFLAVREKLGDMMKCYHDLSFLLYQRTTDVRQLMRSQIRGDVIHFEPTKTEDSSGGQVDVPITPAIRDVLDRAGKLAKLQSLRGGDAPVIQTSDGARYTRSGVYSAYLRADIALHGKDGKLGLNPKALRPYAATSAVKQGFTREQIREGLVHTTIKTTEGYIQHHDVPVSALMLALPVRRA